MKNLNYKILMSGCLLGQPVRYDAKIKQCHDPLIAQWLTEGIVLPVCPEVLGGLPIPRPAAEIQMNNSIQTKGGIDVTDAFVQGAQKTLEMALKHNIKIAVLTERSPSCGSNEIYDGSFNRTLINGQGVAVQLLRDNGIVVFNQFQLAKVQDQLTLL